MKLQPISPDYDYPNPVGDDPSWNESYYFFWSDYQSELAGFSRIGVRTNYGYVEGLHGVFLGGTRIGFAHERRPIADGGPGLHAGGLSFECLEPMQRWALRFNGEVDDIADGKVLEIPRKRRTGDWRARTRLDMELVFDGVGTAVMFLVHDNQEHLEHHGSINGRVRIGDIDRQISGFCFRDKGIGPRTWKPVATNFPRAPGSPATFIKWLEAPFGPDLAFSAILNVQADGLHRGEGLAVVHGKNEFMTELVATSNYLPNSALHDRIEMRGLLGSEPFVITGDVINHIPTKIPTPGGAILVTEGLVRWSLPDGRQTLGMAEFHVVVSKDVVS